MNPELVNSTILTSRRSSVESKGITSNPLQFLIIALELALVLVVLYVFQIEKNQGLSKILPLIFVGFLLFHILPIVFKLPFFFLLTCASMISFLGLRNASIGIGIGLGLLSLCHIPVRFSIRVFLVLTAGIGLASIRSGAIANSWGNEVLPIVASMFMFRIIIYLHEIAKTNPAPASFWQRITYFFLLPNTCFLVFPVIDYKSYLQCRHSEFDKSLQKGINWMVWGILQLLLFRIIYYYWTPDPVDVIDARGVVLYVLTSYSPILRLIGQLYVAAGIVCLFGFNLPPLCQNYMLATGPSDFWRRAYLYWRDFLTKIFYYPVSLFFKPTGLTISILLTSFVLFMFTWLLHSYQFFWLMGRFPITTVDILFWGTFGLAVSGNLIFQLKRKSKKKLIHSSVSVMESFKKSLCGLSFFLFFAMLWSFWNTTSVNEWFNTIAVIKKSTPSFTAMMLLSLIASVALITFLVWLFGRLNLSILKMQGWYQNALVCLVILSAILLIRTEASDSPDASRLAVILHDLQEPRINKRDLRVRQIGYYEPLLDRQRIASELLEEPILPVIPGEEAPTYFKLAVKDLRLNVFRPSVRVFHKGAYLAINSLGFRDKEYAIEKPQNTYRMAFLGGSIEMGSGVENDKIFDAVLEEKLNRLYGKNKNYEILNFSMMGRSLIANMKTNEVQVVRFKPDATFIFLHDNDDIHLISDFREIMESDIDLEKQFLKDVARKSGVSKGMELKEFARRLQPFTEEIAEGVIRQIADDCHKSGTIPVWVWMPPTTGKLDLYSRRRSIAEKNGFVCIDLRNAYGKDTTRVTTLASWDSHPNNEGHRLIAESLYQKLLENRKGLGLDFP